jgi:hypothetical protein
MKLRPAFLLYIILLVMLLSACAVTWQDAIRKGEIRASSFREYLDIEVQNGLIFLPVEIKGETYRFLFDTGAPFSISEALQDMYNYPTLSRGTIKDSDGNKKEVNWVEVDAINLGAISFSNQTAFVGNFTDNPVLGCLEIDGIIGSNLIRHCNWSINTKEKSIALWKGGRMDSLEAYSSLPFTSDQQYSLFVELGIAKASIKPVLVDYGSNGYCSLEGRIYDRLEEEGIFNLSDTEVGFKQSGIVGKAVPIRNKRQWVDEAHLANQPLGSIRIKEGGTTALGYAALSRFEVVINWEDQNLLVKPLNFSIPDKRSFGLKLGWNTSNDMVVQSVILDSEAYLSGIRPNMLVEYLDTLNFIAGSTICDYLDYTAGDTITIGLIHSDGTKVNYLLEKS